ncbi:hypothetical protein X926_09765 [Petrotoga sp. HWHPT.55.6.3]|nr:hypothetical protein X926_09765 [Petrotoga sp. HWHPT.55.6.3]
MEFTLFILMGGERGERALKQKIKGQSPFAALCKKIF